MTRPQSFRRAVFGSCFLFRAVAVVLVLTLISPLLASVGTNEPVVRIAATLGPFGFPVVVNDNKANDQAVPVIAAVPGHGLFVVWQDMRSGNWDIYGSTSLNNGTSFAPNKRADDSIRTSDQIEPAVAVSLNGTILLAWQDNRRSTFDYDVFFAKSYDGGATFTRNVRVDDPTNNISWQERPSIAVTDRGIIYVAWTDDRTGTGLRVRGAFSTDGGATFSPSAEIVPSGGASGQTGVAVVSNGDRIFAAFMDNISGVPHPYVCVSTNGGKSFNSPTRLDNTGSSEASQRGVSIAPMPRGGIVAVWEDSRNGNGDIYASITNANGAIQTPDFRVDDDTTGAYQEDACVASDQLGNLYVVWEDERDGLYAIRFALVMTGKTQPTASIELATPKAADEQRMASVIATEPGSVSVVWQEDKAGTFDVYFSGGYFAGLYDIPLVAGWNFVPVMLVGSDYRASTLGLMVGDVVSGWNSSKATFDQNYIVGVSPSRNDFAISPSTGYWIYANAAETLHLNGTIPTTKQHKAVTVPPGGGWATVGFESLNSTRHASDIPKMYSGGSVQTVGAYDPITGKSTAYINGIPRTDFKLIVGQAYWCFCSANGTLTYDP
jgi:hypothetical protein